MKNNKKPQEKVMCKDCAHSHDQHELTAYEPRVPFMCRCPFRQWSQFLDIPQICEHFKRR
jgi:hypothetical protein